MRVFVTGATGLIGSVVVPELITAGHEVLGLARSDASAKALTAAGVSVLRGDLNDPESLRTGAAQSDGVIHLAFGDFNDFPKAIAEETLAVETFASALVDSGSPWSLHPAYPSCPDAPQPNRTRSLPKGLWAPAAATPRLFWTSPSVTSAPRSSVFPAQSTPQASAADLPRCSSMQPGAPGSLAMSATAPSAGRPCIASTPPSSSGWSSKTRLPAR